MIHHDKPIGYPLAVISCSVVAGATASSAIFEHDSRARLLFTLGLVSIVYHVLLWKGWALVTIIPECLRLLFRPSLLFYPSPPVYCAVCFRAKAEAILQMPELRIDQIRQQRIDEMTEEHINEMLEQHIEEMNNAFREVAPEHHCLATAAPVERPYYKLFDGLAAVAGTYVPR